MSDPERIWLQAYGQYSHARREDNAPSDEYIRADAVAEMIQQAVLAEREACAKVCEGWKEWNSYTTDIAVAIRARVET